MTIKNVSVDDGYGENKTSSFCGLIMKEGIQDSGKNASVLKAIVECIPDALFPLESDYVKTVDIGRLIRHLENIKGDTKEEEKTVLSCPS